MTPAQITGQTGVAATGYAAKFSGAALALFLSIGPTIWALVIFIVADFLSGLAAAYFRQKVDSGIARRGALTKVLMLGCVFVFHVGQKLAAGTVNLPVDFGSAVAGFFIMTELISIVENLAVCEVPIPKFVVDALVKLRPQKASAEQLKELGNKPEGA